MHTIRKGGNRRPSTPSSPVSRYDALKATWRFANPNASPREYERAMTAIARRVGI
jgi:hypothetical protein